MFRFHPIFWLVVALFFLFRMQRRSMRRRWAMGGPMGYAPFGWRPWGDARTAQWAQQQPQVPAAPQPLAQPDRTLVESLESRIAELESRLEFAERLMASKKE
jgi:hypothetical protein